MSKKCDFKILSIYEMGICVNLRIFLFTEDTLYWIYKLYLNNVIFAFDFGVSLFEGGAKSIDLTQPFFVFQINNSILLSQLSWWVFSI